MKDDRELLVSIIQDDRRRFDSVLSSLLGLEARRLDVEERTAERTEKQADRYMSMMERIGERMIESMKPPIRPIADAVKAALRDGEITADALRGLAEEAEEA